MSDIKTEGSPVMAGDRRGAAASAPSINEDMVKEAIAVTEAEIFAEAMGDDTPELDGDTTLEEQGDVAGDDIPGDEDAESEDGEDEGDGPEDDDDDAEDDEGEGDEAQAGDEPARRDQRLDEPRVPPGRLREERERRTAVERERDDLRSRLDQLTGQVEALSRVQQRPAAPAQPQKTEPPDQFADPDGYRDWLRNDLKAELAREYEERALNASFAGAHEEHGEDFEVAYKALTALNPQNPADIVTVQRITRAPNPGRALMRWAEPIVSQNRESQAERVLELLERDPDLADRILGTAQRRANGDDRGRREGGPRNETRPARRMPPSLNSASGGGSQRRGTLDPRGFDGSEGAVFDYAFGDK